MTTFHLKEYNQSQFPANAQLHSVYIMIVTTRSNSIDKEGPHFFDAREAHDEKEERKEKYKSIKHGNS